MTPSVYYFSSVKSIDRGFVRDVEEISGRDNYGLGGQFSQSGDIHSLLKKVEGTISFNGNAIQ